MITAREAIIQQALFSSYLNATPTSSTPESLVDDRVGRNPTSGCMGLVLKAVAVGGLVVVSHGAAMSHVLRNGVAQRV